MEEHAARIESVTGLLDDALARGPLAGLGAVDALRAQGVDRADTAAAIAHNVTRGRYRLSLANQLSLA